MHTTTRALAALLVGATALLGGTVACATPHTTDGYISEVRGQMDDYESRNMADAHIVTMGQSMCAYPESMEPATWQNEWTSPAQQEKAATLAEVTKRYCDVLPPMTTPINETDAGTPMEGDPGNAAPAAPIPPTPITVGRPIPLNYGGTTDVSTTTINNVTRCGAEDLIVDMTVKTSDVWSPNDTIAQTVDYVDSDGVTRTATAYASVGSTCGGYEKSFPMTSDMKPSKTYQGLVQYQVPAGATTTLNFNGTDGAVRTLDVTGK